MRCGKSLGRIKKRSKQVEIIHSVDANYFTKKKSELQRPPSK
jgi:hypothetical protein